MFQFSLPVVLCAFIIKPIFAFSELKEPDKVVSRDGPNRGVSYVNFVEEKFSYLNITALGGDFVDNMPQCSFACLDTPLPWINIGYSPAGRSVLGKTVPEVLDTSRGRRPGAVIKTEGTVFPNTDRPRLVNNIFIFFYNPTKGVRKTRTF